MSGRTLVHGVLMRSDVDMKNRDPVLLQKNELEYVDRANRFRNEGKLWAYTIKMK
jgi:hypothetical protein